ncbi:MAG: type II toxin-antitoxin system RelE/ParE family toxin [Planctomycetes bacterium]|nr:type II toxin-antitoxin system RelE/ParE family toxin [Planctomycetota bacterium]
MIVAPPAEEDLRRNAQWWADNHSALEAERWFASSHKQLATLKTFPERCPLSAENDTVAFEIRDFLFGRGSKPSYRAIITIEESVVYVLRIVRGEQDTVRPDDLS